MKEAARGMAVKISDGPVPIGCDNQGAINLITSGVQLQKSKHIDLKYHHVHDELIFFFFFVYSLLVCDLGRS